MKIGIGLPATIPGVERGELLEWARRSESAGFSTLGVLDRIVYPNWEPFVALGAAAAVTERIGLTTAIAIAPYRNTALLAKDAATVDQISGGRLVLGLAIGARDDDYEAAGLTTAGRGARLERQIDELRRIWSGEKFGYAGAIGPTPVNPDGPPIVVGGGIEKAFDRAARLGDGWIMGGGAPDQFAAASSAVDEAWRRHGRDGRPRKMALAYFSLGPDARSNADSYIGDYYGWLGDMANQIAASVAVDADMVGQYLAAFRDAGCDELILFPCSTDPAQVDLLAEAAAPGSEST